MATIDRTTFFDAVRAKPFGGTLTQQQVDGMEYKLGVFEEQYATWDLRWVAYAFATSFHETGAKMWPVSEIGKGEGHDYGKPDPKTGQTYYGRGDVQLTWSTNYQRADAELHLSGAKSCYLHADNALEPATSAQVLYQGMSAGWFRRNSGGQPYTLGMFFNDVSDNPVGAREIINGDKNVKPSWGGGKTIGQLVAGYHASFLAALVSSFVEEPYPPAPEPLPEIPPHVAVGIETTPGVRVIVIINGAQVFSDTV